MSSVPNKMSVIDSLFQIANISEKLEEVIFEGEDKNNASLDASMYNANPRRFLESLHVDELQKIAGRLRQREKDEQQLGNKDDAIIFQKDQQNIELNTKIGDVSERDFQSGQPAIDVDVHGRSLEFDQPGSVHELQLKSATTGNTGVGYRDLKCDPPSFDPAPLEPEPGHSVNSSTISLRHNEGRCSGDSRPNVSYISRGREAMQPIPLHVDNNWVKQHATEHDHSSHQAVPLHRSDIESRNNQTTKLINAVEHISKVAEQLSRVGPLTHQNQQLQEQIASYEETIRNLEDEIADLREQCQQQQEQIASYEETVRNLEDENTDLREQCQQLQEQIASNEETMMNKQLTFHRLSDTLREQIALFERIVKNLHERNRNLKRTEDFLIEKNEERRDENSRLKDEKMNLQDEFKRFVKITYQFAEEMEREKSCQLERNKNQTRIIEQICKKFIKQKQELMECQIGRNNNSHEISQNGSFYHFYPSRGIGNIRQLRHLQHRVGLDFSDDAKEGDLDSQRSEDDVD